MPEENNKEKEEQEQELGQQQQPRDNAPAPEELEALKAQLEEERKAKSEIEQALMEKDARLAELEKALEEAKAASTELSQLKDSHSRAVSKYLEALRAANPSIPPDVISGQSIDEIDASLEKAKAIAKAVRASLEQEAQQTAVPAGAPPRVTISPEGLSPREKIALGITQKGVTS